MDCDRHRGSIGAPLADLQRVFEGQGLRTMSALPPKADIASRQFDVCFVPIADITHMRASQTAKPPALSVSGRLRSDRVACGRTKEPPLIREAAFASSKAPLRPVPAQVDPADASEERQASAR
jgi:hypothetical protein